MRLGATTISQIYLGETPINRIYLGSTLIYGDAPAAPAPVLTGVTYTDNNDGTPASLAITYTGDVTGYRVYIATGGASLAVSAAQLYAGAGGTDTIEFADFAVGSDIDVTGLTSASEAATQIAVALIKSADGSDPSNVVLEDVTGLDFTAPTLSSAASDSAGTAWVLTMSENIFGTEDAGDWTAEVDAVPITVSAVDITGSTITLTVTPAPLNGDVLTVSYSGGDLTDADGNALAAISDAAVTNNVPSAGGSSGLAYSDDGYDADVYAGPGTIAGLALNAGWTIIAVMPINFNATGLSSMTVGGETAVRLGGAGTWGDGTVPVEFWKVTVPAGGTGSIVATFAGQIYHMHAAVYAVDSEPTFHQAAIDQTSVSGLLTTNIDVPANGNIIAIATRFNGDSPSWVGATASYATTTGYRQFGAIAADLSSESGRTVSVTFGAGSDFDAGLGVLSFSV